ncbi:troponin domain-containing protein [Ditylenchus destructor]|nr:troponin domain-containing protein [Ditylenchus destructor]
MGAGFVSTPPIGSGGRNFIIPEKKDKTDKFGNIVQAKQEMGMTIEQQDEAKRNFLSSLMKSIDVSELSGSDLKAKIKEMHHRICKLETEKYDLDKRHERQIYDLKEMNERQRNINRNKQKLKGLEPGDMENSRYPPKISISSKYDRQIDRRNFKERKHVFDKKNAFPCFPNVPPPPTILEYKIPFASNGREEDEDEEEEE